ncbi:MAG: hypothetical protein ACOCTH_02805 [Halodesulfurarchaeum sp.]
MALSKGELSSVRKKLSNAFDGALTEDQRDRLAKAFPEAARDGYEGAGEQADEQAALIAAAEDGDVSGKYKKFYRRNPDIREALSDAASSAFSQSDKDAISKASDSAQISEAYAHCSRGEFDEAAELIGEEPDEFDPDSANECRNMVQTMSGFADKLSQAYEDN